MLQSTASRTLLALCAALIAVAFWWVFRDPLTSPSGPSLRYSHDLEVAEPERFTEVTSRTSAIVEIEPAPEPTAVDPAPSYPFDPEAPIPHLRLNLAAMQSPALLMNLLRTNSFVNPGRIPFTEQEAQKLLDGAQPEIALTLQAQQQFLDEKSAAVNRSVEQYEGPRFNSFDEAASYARSTFHGTRMGSVIIKQHQGAQATMAIILDAEKELATYLLYKEMLDVADVAAARIRELIEAGAYR